MTPVEQLFGQRLERAEAGDSQLLDRVFVGRRDTVVKDGERPIEALPRVALLHEQLAILIERGVRAGRNLAEFHVIDHGSLRNFYCIANCPG